MNSDLHRSIVRPTELRDSGLRSAVYRAAVGRSLHRLVPGRFIDSTQWQQLDGDERYRLLVHAASERLPTDDVVSHWSAAALWRLPIIGRWPERVHASTLPNGRRGSTTTVTRHQRELATATELIDGIAVTSLAETIIDIARVASFAQAVAMGDAGLWRQQHPRDAQGLAGVTRAQLAEVVSLSREHRGLARARRVLEFIDGDANRPGESLSRVTMAELGAPAPTLQHKIYLPDGRWYELDFYWREFNVGADFDGRLKYFDERYRGGRTAEQVVYDEKVREDHVRSGLRGYGRFDWVVAGSVSKMADKLRSIGVRW